MKYETIRNRPVAKFFYKGTHGQPIRRTVLITETDKGIIKGYEVREGNVVRDADDAPIKSFRKDKIAKFCQLRKGSARHSDSTDSTLERMSKATLAKVGV